MKFKIIKRYFLKKLIAIKIVITNISCIHMRKSNFFINFNAYDFTEEQGLPVFKTKLNIINFIINTL